MASRVYDPDPVYSETQVAPRAASCTYRFVVAGLSLLELLVDSCQVCHNFLIPLGFSGGMFLGNH